MKSEELKTAELGTDNTETTEQIENPERTRDQSFEAQPSKPSSQERERLRAKDKALLDALQKFKNTKDWAKKLADSSNSLEGALDESNFDRPPKRPAKDAKDLLGSLRKTKNEHKDVLPELERRLSTFEKKLNTIQNGSFDELALNELQKEEPELISLATKASEDATEGKRRIQSFVDYEVEKLGYPPRTSTSTASSDLIKLLSVPKRGWRENIFSTPERKSAEKKLKRIWEIEKLEDEAKKEVLQSSKPFEAAADLAIASCIVLKKAADAYGAAQQMMGTLDSSSIAGKIKIAARLNILEEAAFEIKNNLLALENVVNNLDNRHSSVFGTDAFSSRPNPVVDAPEKTKVQLGLGEKVATANIAIEQINTTKEKLLDAIYKKELDLKRLTEDPAIRAEIGEGDLELGSARIDAATLEIGLEVFNSATKKQWDHSLQEALLTFRHPDIAPYAILNCFQNTPGGWRRMIGQGVSPDSEKSPIYLYTQSLTDEERMAIADKNIPGLSTIISMVLENPKSFSRDYLDDKISIPNPEYPKLWREVNRAALYLFQTAIDPKERVISSQAINQRTLAINLLAKSDYLDPESLSTMEHIAQEDEVYMGREVMAKIAGQRCDSVESAVLLFKIYPLLKPHEREGLERGHVQPHTFFNSLIRSNLDLLSDDNFPIFAQIFSDQPSELLKGCLKGIRILSEKGIENANGLQYAALYAQIGASPTLADDINELSEKYGFTFNPGDAGPAIEALVTNKERLIKDIETIRVVFPGFRFLNTKRPADPYGDLVDNFGAFGEFGTLTLAKARQNPDPKIQEALRTVIEHIKAPLYAKAHLDQSDEYSQDLMSSKKLYEAMGVPFDPNDPDLRKIILNGLERIPFSGLSESGALPTWIKKVQDANPQPVEVPGSHLLELIKRLEGLQTRVANEKYDPWLTDLNPLIAQALNNKIISLDSAADAEAIYSFVAEYGMHNTELLFRYHLELSRAGTSSDLKPETLAAIEEVLGISLDSIPQNKLFEQVTTELKKLRKRIQSDLLSDTISKEMVTDLGINIFNTLKSTPSTWARGGQEKEIIGQWQKTLEEHPELGLLPEGYKELTLKISEVAQSNSDDPKAQERRAKKQAEILTNPDLKRIVGQFQEAFVEARRIDDIQTWWKGKVDQFYVEIGRETATLDERIATVKNPKAADSMRNQRSKLSDGFVKINAIQAPEISSDQLPEWDKKMIEFMGAVALAIPEQLKAREQILRTLSALHQDKVIASTGIGRVSVLEQAVEQTNLNTTITVDAFKSWESHFSEYIKEHYLNDDQANHEVAQHAEIPPDLLKTLQSVWGTRIKSGEHPLAQAKTKINELVSGEKTGKTTEIALVPSKGLLRIYGGDIGDACYSSRHSELANGEYKNLTEFSFVTGRGTANERLRGSVLVIETTKTTGEKVMVIRANNPQEGLLRQIDGEGLVMETIKGLQSIAKARNIETVTVPLDDARQSCSNRDKVAEVYKKNFTGRKGIMLTDEPETNFNTAKIWNAAGPNKVVEV